MKISIIIPVYNVAPYIKRCLDSVAAQTYTGDLECILVDDCGSDNSIQIAKQFILDYKGSIHFTIIQHSENRGQSAARNDGIYMATGEYVYFLDSDDAITSKCIDTLYSLAVKYPKADFVQGKTSRNTEQLTKNWSECAFPEYCDNKDELPNLILHFSYRTAWNKLLKRDFILGKSLYFPVGLIMEDHYWTWYLAKFANAVAFTNERTYFYTQNDNSTVNSAAKEMQIRRYTSYLKVAHAITSDMITSGISQKYLRVYAGEAFVFALENVARINSLVHWWRFWVIISKASWRWRTKLTLWRGLFLIGMLPPVCFLSALKGWRWRLRHYILSNI